MNTTQHTHIEIDQYVDSIYFLSISNDTSLFFENLVRENEIESILNRFV